MLQIIFPRDTREERVALWCSHSIEFKIPLPSCLSFVALAVVMHHSARKDLFQRHLHSINLQKKRTLDLLHAFLIIMTISAVHH
jgi:hypothetical protein